MIFYKHGSEDSVDLDVYYIFDKLPSFRECQEFCANKEENRNIITIENGIVTECFKGTVDEINNGLYYTYPLHKQEFENPIKRLVERDTLIKVVRVLRCLLSHCSKSQYREIVKKALKSHSWLFKIDVLKLIDFTSIDDYGKNGNKEDILKVFAFQLGQIFGLFKGKELYTKSTVANEFHTLKKYLYREKNSNLDDLISYIDVFIKVISQYNIEEQNKIVYFKDFNKYIDLIKESYALSF